LDSLTGEIKALHDRRKGLFLQELQNKRKLTRVEVYIKALKTFASKEIFDLSDRDVLDFLIYKDVDDSGRTIVHFKSCPFIGTDNS